MPANTRPRRFNHSRQNLLVVPAFLLGNLVVKPAMKILISLLLLGSVVCAGGSALAAPSLKPDLAEHLVWQLSSRTNGGSPDFTGPTDGSNWFQRAPRLAPNFWLRDVQNILAMSQGRLSHGGIASCADYLTPISPHVCVGAAHTGGGVGSFNVWLRPDGSYYTNIITACLAPTNSSDILLMFMARTNCTFAKIFPNAVGKLKYWRHPTATNVIPVFVRFHQGIGRTNEFHSTFVSGSAALGTFWHVPGQFAYGDYSRGDLWVGGDSGGAAYAIVQNEAVLVGCAFGPGYAPAIANYTNQVNAAMAKLCAKHGLPAEKVTLYDLGDFQDY